MKQPVQDKQAVPCRATSDNCRWEIRRVMIAVNRIDGLYYAFARQNGAKYNTVALLYALQDGERHSQKQICDEWLIPRTTINTVVKECARAGYVTLTALGNREKAVELTETGRIYTDRLLQDLLCAENTAMAKTVELYSADFVPALEYFTEQLGAALPHNDLPSQAIKTEKQE